MGHNWRETAVRYSRLPKRVSRFLFFVYTAFISILPLVHASVSPKAKYTDLDLWQQISVLCMQQIGWIVLVGLTTAGVWACSSVLIVIAQRGLKTEGNESPCVGSLLKAAYTTLTSGNFLKPHCQITLYKAINEQRLEVFASLPATSNRESSFSLSGTSETDHEILLRKCWGANQDMQKAYGDRHPESSLRLKNSAPNIKAMVIFPVIVSPHDTTPWGFVCIRTSHTLTLKQSQELIEKLNTPSGLITTFENLLEQQRKVGHFVCFAD